MSAASCLMSEDQFLCSICLDVFTDPVSTPCGHNFCKSCITEHWNVSVCCWCPMCKRHYNTRPELHVNTFISEMVAQFRHSAQWESSSSSRSEPQAAEPGDVPCDVCAGTKLKALKSCVVCLSSFCETHLEPHRTMAGLKRHQLIDPVGDLEGRMCTKHDKLLEMFCKTDRTCVCMVCTVLDHKMHSFVPLKEEYDEKKVELQKTEAEIQQMIQRRREKIEEIRHSVQFSSDDADREIAEGVQVFTALKESIDRGLNELIKEIEEKQRGRENQAEYFINYLEQEICELEKRSSEVEKLSCSGDHLHLIQNFSSLNAAPPTKDWSEVSVCSSSYEGTVMRAVDKVEKTLSEQMKRLFKAELKRIQRYAVHVTLDPDVVHPKPNQSNERKQEGGDCRCVSSKQGFSSGRFYFEVKVEKWPTWTLGVTTKSERKGLIRLSPHNGYWTVCSKCVGEYVASADPSVRLSLKSKPDKVGVFVDYEDGLISFYDVCTAALIYSFTGCFFTEKLYPFFSPCSSDGLQIHTPELNCILQ